MVNAVDGTSPCNLQLFTGIKGDYKTLCDGGDAIREAFILLL